MMIDGLYLKFMWAGLAGLWGLAFVVRCLLVYLSWPDDRGWRVAFAVIHLLCTGYFIWRMETDMPPATILLSDLARNAISAILVIYLLLDGVRAVYKLAERRAQRAAAFKESL
ncbi:hypothetical protein [Deinococcus petrolearius]|uniref:Uncharacterized protein n=1 Tax=Deinococcus petrolearius TaxID=1751295 RepID=A0ABW1DFA1_9DEIO